MHSCTAVYSTAVQHKEEAETRGLELTRFWRTVTSHGQIVFVTTALCECLIRQYGMYVYLMYHCINEVQRISSSTTAVHYTTYYYTAAALFAVCTDTLLARRHSRASDIVRYTRLYAASLPATVITGVHINQDLMWCKKKWYIWVFVYIVGPD